jgi:hypothetical protein
MVTSVEKLWRSCSAAFRAAGGALAKSEALPNPDAKTIRVAKPMDDAKTEDAGLKPGTYTAQKGV